MSGENYVILSKKKKLKKNMYIYKSTKIIHIIITNCRQYCFGLLGLISAVLMSGMKVSL